MVFRMCVLRKILGVSRWARIKNVDIMQELGIDKDIVLNFSFFFSFFIFITKKKTVLGLLWSRLVTLFA